MQIVEFRANGRGYHATAQLASGATAASVDADGDVVLPDTIGIFLSPTLYKMTTQIVTQAASTCDVFYSCASHEAIKHAVAALQTAGASETTAEATLRAAGSKVSFLPWASGAVGSETSFVDFFEAPITAVMVIARGTGGAFAHCLAG